MKTEKVTRKMLREIPPGSANTFELPDGAACDTAKTVAYQLKNIDGVKYTATTDYSANKVTINRLAK